MAKVTFSGGRWYVNGVPKDRAGPYRRWSGRRRPGGRPGRAAVTRTPDGGVL